MCVFTFMFKDVSSYVYLCMCVQVHLEPGGQLQVSFINCSLTFYSFVAGSNVVQDLTTWLVQLTSKHPGSTVLGLQTSYHSWFSCVTEIKLRSSHLHPLPAHLFSVSRNIFIHLAMCLNNRILVVIFSVFYFKSLSCRQRQLFGSIPSLPHFWKQEVLNPFSTLTLELWLYKFHISLEHPCLKFASTFPSPPKS